MCYAQQAHLLFKVDNVNPYGFSMAWKEWEKHNIVNKPEEGTDNQ